MKVDPNGVYLNLGCGENVLGAPWMNYDRTPYSPGVKSIELTQPLPFPTSSVDGILLEHVLEHFDGPTGFRLLEQCYRALVPRGVLRVCVPQLLFVSRDKARDLICNHGHQMVYCFNNLAQMLEAVGFRDTLVQPIREACDGHWRKIGLEQDDLETLRVEAIK